MIKLVNFISSYKGGGAELLVRELHKKYLNKGLSVNTFYFSGDPLELEKNESILGLAPRSPINIFRVRKVLKNLSRDSEDKIIVHVHLTWPLFYVTLASLGLSNIKLIYTEHSTHNKRRNIPLLWMFERLVYARFSRIICISRGVQEALGKWLGPKIAQRLVTIPNGSRIYALTSRPGLEGRLPRLVSVGSLSARKNFSTAIHAIAQLKREIDTYTIIGEGPERPRLQQVISSEQLEGKVQLVGWSDAIEGHLHAADIQLIPSLWEGFGLVAVEGMSTGLPVVASNVDGLREVLDESNPSITLVDHVESVDEWVSAIRKAVADLHAWGACSLAQSSRQQAEQFTLDQMAEYYLDVYRQA